MVEPCFALPPPRVMTVVDGGDDDADDDSFAARSKKLETHTAAGDALVRLFREQRWCRSYGEDKQLCNFSRVIHCSLH